VTRTGVPIFAGLAAAAVTLGILWPVLGDPAAVPLPIGAAIMVGVAVGGVVYLSMNVKP
jgi:hypothetical protein